MSAAEGTRRRRVLHVVQNLNYGGMERLIADLAGRADPARVESHVLVLQYAGRFSRDLPPAVALHLSDPLPKWSLLWPAPLARRIAAIAPDVVHTHTGVWLKAARAARMARVPRVIHTAHGQARPDSIEDRLLERAAARYTDLVVAVSDPLADWLRRAGIARSARLRVITNGVDTERFRPLPATDRLAWELRVPAGAPILGSIGRLERIKGYDVMLHAFALLPAGAADRAPHLVVAGDGSERDALSELARRLGVHARVHLLGWRDRTEELLPEMDLFTMASRSEGTSVSLLEAMSAGVCPVVTDVGGNAAVLGDGLAHRLVAPEDPAALARAWSAALAEPSRLRGDGEAARRRVVESWSVERMVHDYEQLYLEPAGTAPAPAEAARLPRPAAAR
jgi:glycosyltransferase involved in cell wall biosynthesis